MLLHRRSLSLTGNDQIDITRDVVGLKNMMTHLRQAYGHFCRQVTDKIVQFVRKIEKQSVAFNSKPETNKIKVKEELLELRTMNHVQTKNQTGMTNKNHSPMSDRVGSGQIRFANARSTSPNRNMYVNTQDINVPRISGFQSARFQQNYKQSYTHRQRQGQNNFYALSSKYPLPQYQPKRNTKMHSQHSTYNIHSKSARQASQDRFKDYKPLQDLYKYKNSYHNQDYMIGGLQHVHTCNKRHISSQPLQYRQKTVGSRNNPHKHTCQKSLKTVSSTDRLGVGSPYKMGQAIGVGENRGPKSSFRNYGKYFNNDYLI